MVESNVEYIDKEVEGGVQASSDEETDEPVSWVFSMIGRLLVPGLVTVFSLLYLDSVVGRIRTENLYYPLLVIGTILFLTVTVYLTELRRVVRIKRKYDVPFRTTLQEVREEWWQAIALVGAIVVYLPLITLLGFFPSTFLAMIALMYIGGNRNPILIFGTTVVLLLIIYLLFVEFVNMGPPEGIITELL